MATSSFSLLLCNLFVGLTKGARGLGKHATDFKRLGDLPYGRWAREPLTPGRLFHRG